MFTYFLIAAAVVLVGAAIWVQVRGRNRPGRHITQNAPMDDTKNSWAKWQHDATQNGQISGGGPA
ncbi:hypothetical protein [Nocardioides sp. SR21]|uniref:hypothetical protein n=1 Tax=Nocardioides sp. SR21 TaxID=2919501 RepID=UPI001FAB2A8E|nr:hypothetical protein [Nocardioides sp. SR21]